MIDKNTIYFSCLKLCLFANEEMACFSCVNLLFWWGCKIANLCEKVRPMSQSGLSPENVHQKLDDTAGPNRFSNINWRSKISI